MGPRGDIDMSVPIMGDRMHDEGIRVRANEVFIVAD